MHFATQFIGNIGDWKFTVVECVWLGEEVPAHKALRNCISLSLGRLPDLSWKRRPGRPRGRWIDQFRRDNSQPPADQWKQAINRGHSGRATQRSSDYAATWPDLIWYRQHDKRGYAFNFKAHPFVTFDCLWAHVYERQYFPAISIFRHFEEISAVLFRSVLCMAISWVDIVLLRVEKCVTK